MMLQRLVDLLMGRLNEARSRPLYLAAYTRMIKKNTRRGRKGRTRLVEIRGCGYKRVEFYLAQGPHGLTSDREIIFPTATASWPQIYQIAIHDQPAGGYKLWVFNGEPAGRAARSWAEAVTTSCPFLFCVEKGDRLGLSKFLVRIE